MKKLTLLLSTFIFTALASNVTHAQFNMEVKSSSTKTVNGQVVSSESSHSKISSDNGLKVQQSSASLKNGKLNAESNEFGINKGLSKDKQTKNAYQEDFMRPKSSEEIAALRLAKAEKDAAKAATKQAKQEQKLLKEQQKIAEQDAKLREKEEAERKRKEEGAWITQKIKGADKLIKSKKAKKEAEPIQETEITE